MFPLTLILPSSDSLLIYLNTPCRDNSNDSAVKWTISFGCPRILLRMKATDVSVIGRNTQGVRVIKLGDKDKLINLAKVEE